MKAILFAGSCIVMYQSPYSSPKPATPARQLKDQVRKYVLLGLSLFSVVLSFLLFFVPPL